jgi:Bacterial membrane protein YfhO
LALLLTCLLVILDAWHFGESIIGVSQINEDPVWAGARANVPLGADSRVVAPGGYENLASVTGHLNVAGYDPLPIETYSKFAALGNPADPTSAVNTLLGVKYLFTTRRYHTRTSFRDFALIGTTSQAFYYQRNYPFPRTWIAPSVVVDGNDDRVLHDIVSGKVDMRSTVYLDRALPCIASGDPSAKITEYKANSLEIKTSGGAGVLTVSDQFYPGWQATVDGQPTDIVRADAVFRAVCVPPGDHTVRFDYRPGSLYVGVAISAAGWLALFAFAIFALVSGRRKKVA